MGIIRALMWRPETGRQKSPRLGGGFGSV